ncbi:hypothetical protein FMN52_02055 [Marinobacter sp. BW6]|uniref:hypothetical protein n=1 Tax=Marinobacter sp. BW6 TaxID=2592624 RepID=UPI0011DE7A37|nr:hypothetical protein [Marinobacter sp. BW6]TYC62562.1 hypothetical protein FMN52_02055 [Marinobacter sp. BW6]
MFDPEIISRYPVKESVETILSRFNRTAPYSLDYEFVISQAQTRLANRSKRELTAGAIHLRKLLARAEETEQEQIMEKMRAGEQNIFQTDPSKFSAFFQEFDLDDQSDFPNASPTDYFAILVLVYALESLELQLQVESWEAQKDSLDPIQALRLPGLQVASGERLQSAVGLINFIEGIEFEAIFRRKIAKGANRAKNRAYQNLKQKIFDFIDSECQELSSRKAAQVAYLQFKDQVSSTLNSDDPEHQIAKWIGTHRKGTKKPK